MDKTWEFINFLSSFEEYDKPLVESIHSGYLALFESDVPTNAFSMDEFKKLKSFAARKRYADSTLKRIGQGSSRAAYEINPTTILKMAINKKGVAQNQAEGDWGLHHMYDILPELYDKDEDNDLWLLMQRATPLKSPNRFEELVKLPWNTFAACVNYELARIHGREKMLRKPPELENLYNEENPFFTSIIDMAGNFDMPSGDLTRLSSYGEVGGKPVLLDAGLTQGVYDEFYRRN